MAQLTGKMSLGNDSNTNNNRTNCNIVQPSQPGMVGSAQHGGYVRAKLDWMALSSPLDIDLEAAQ
eukprot:CAMPEP_0171300962 /NCGR_PEP_ID=MMETSP0816-20121228/9970_1 /TAXON_ID=420281 /ORGANISM="Proboscia inermis, Strain CCAP1064/1" /LENGTH=64 /DNA_ID=CAMNT_0011778035 /DNA_START=167 /DNA_END=361 /DNA_ORIENTATION=+